MEPGLGAGETFGVATRSEAGPVDVLAVRGELDAATSPTLRRAAAEWMEGRAGPFVLDLTETTFIDSSGLGLLVTLNRQIRDHGQESLTLRGLQDPVRRVLDLTGLTNLFDVLAPPTASASELPSGGSLEGVARDASTLLEVLQAFEAEGYRGQFVSRPEGMVECATCRVSTAVERIATQHLRRLEGASDPADMLAVAALTCPHCETSGTLVLNYGPTATPEDDRILRLIEAPPPDPDEVDA